MAQLKATADAAQGELAEAKAALADTAQVKAEKAAVDLELAQVKAAAAAVRGELTQANADKAAVDLELAQVKAAADAIRGELAQANAAADAIRGELTQANANTAQANAAADAIRGELTQANANTAQANADKAAVDLELTQVKAAVDAVRGELTQANAQKEVLRQSLEASRSNVDALTARAMVYERERNEARAGLEAATRKNNELAGEITRLQGKNSQQARQIARSTIQGTINSLNQQLMQLDPPTAAPTPTPMAGSFAACIASTNCMPESRVSIAYGPVEPITSQDASGYAGDSLFLGDLEENGDDTRDSTTGLSFISAEDMPGTPAREFN